ncbi:MAG: cytochrome c family protein [Rhodobacteraceae bacterium]|nr:cytochrome c family protein [Paracoccaceae bacterium]
MFNTMTIAKVFGALFGSLAVYLLMAWTGNALFSVGRIGDDQTAAYVIETGSGAATEEASAEETPDFETLYAAADAAAGEKVFSKCKACHKVDGANAVGPHLNGVVDRPKASVGDFGYSEALLAMAGDVWSPENLNGYLENPKSYAPDNKMSFAGLPKVQDRANVIAYLAANP